MFAIYDITDEKELVANCFSRIWADTIMNLLSESHPDREFKIEEIPDYGTQF